MKQSYNAEVIIVGGGLIGSVLAYGLSKRRIKTVLIEKQPLENLISQQYDNRTTAIAITGQIALKNLGLWDHLSSNAGAIRHIRVSDGSSPKFLHFKYNDITDKPMGYIIENIHLRKVLYKSIKESNTLKIFNPATITETKTSESGVTIKLSNNKEVKGQLLVGADGKSSIVRQQAGINISGWEYKQTAIITTIQHSQPHNEIAYEHFLPSGPFAILPMKDRNCSSIVWTEKNYLADAFLELSRNRLTQEINNRIGPITGSISIEGPVHQYPLSFQIASRYFKCRTVLAGDSAHSIHPIAGQGLNLGLRDVSALIDILTHCKRYGLDMSERVGLSRYEQWRKTDNLMMAGMTDILNRIFSNDMPTVRFARNIGLGFLNKIPSLKKFFMLQAMGKSGRLPSLMNDDAL